LGLVFAGGGVGSVFRLLVQELGVRRFGQVWPVGTMAVNLAGSFLMGALMYLAVSTPHLREPWRLALCTGVLGGFTTYSAFNYETVRFFQQGQGLVGALYLAGTVLGCLALGLAGHFGARAVFGT
jgi:CrcB protein